VAKFHFIPVAVSLLVASLVTTSRAHADPATDADTLFVQGKALYASGSYVEARDKLVASEKLDPAVGTLAAIAACFEKEAKFASALRYLEEGVALAVQKNDATREGVLRAKIKELEPSLSTLRIEMQGQGSSKTTPPMRLLLDGVRLNVNTLPAVVRADAGTHTLAYAYLGVGDETPRNAEVALTVGEQNKVVTLGAPPTAKAPASRLVRVERAHSTRPLAWGLIGASALSLTTGLYFGVRTVLSAREASSACVNSLACTDHAKARSAHLDASSFGTYSNIFLGLGVLVGAGGLVAWYLDPARETKERIPSSPSPSRTPGGQASLSLGAPLAGPVGVSFQRTF
jgi:hypothetical protein